MMTLLKRTSLGPWWALFVMSTALVLHSGGRLQATPSTSGVSNLQSGLTVDHASFVDDYLEVADEIDPTLADQLRSMCQLDPGRFGKVLRQLGPVLGQLVDLRQSDPQLFRRKIQELHLEATIESLATSIRVSRARGEMADPAKAAQLRALVQAQFGASLRTRQEVINRMQEELKQAQVRLSREKKDFVGEVDRRLHRLLSE
ncbi:MAG: hypothetical protein P8I91_04205 [Phycisphaerales bacterium]|nr:hypothetical protein [Phycisphaerales bacterium]